jgi:hypothetical protein
MSPQNLITIEEQQPQFSKLRSGCVNVDSWFKSISETIVKSVFWRLLIAGLTLILLFGSPIQLWLVPKEGDIAFDALYCFGFVIFMIDVVLNSYADPEYLVCDPCNPRRLNRSSHANRNFSCRQQQFFGVGSFNFWCDLISSVGFLYDVSFIDTSEFAMQYIHIELNDIGVPVRSSAEETKERSNSSTCFDPPCTTLYTHTNDRSTSAMLSIMHGQWNKISILSY